MLVLYSSRVYQRPSITLVGMFRVIPCTLRLPLYVNRLIDELKAPM